jgi:hypothetical protein
MWTHVRSHVDRVVVLKDRAIEVAYAVKSTPPNGVEVQPAADLVLPAQLAVLALKGPAPLSLIAGQADARAGVETI